MDIQLSEFGALMPEIFVLSMACLVLLVDLFLGDGNRGYTYALSLLTLFGAAGLTYGQSVDTAALVLSGTFVSDEMSKLLKMFIYIVTAGVLVYSRQYLLDRQIYKGEFFTLVLFGVLGMMVLVSAHNFITVYLGLELLSLSLYALVAMQRDSIAATEAAMKYFVLGALASGMLLYGISMLYGATGSLDIAKVAGTIAAANDTDLVLELGVVFVIVGLAFKLGAVPFHMWIPDVYHGAPTAITLFIATAPKIAAFAMVMRLLAEGLGGLHDHWQDLLVILAVLSMGIGNIIAIAQGNLKRMLAYSTIAHVGYLFLGILAGTPEGYSAAMFYIIVYAIMSLGGFGMIILLSRAGFEADRLEDFKGLNERSPWFAAMMLLLMFSMAGVPPTVGFYAKLSVLQAVVSVDMVWLAIVAIIFSVIGAFYYLRVLKFIYFEKAEDREPLQAPFEMQAALSANGIAVLALGLFPGSLMAMCAAALGG